MKPKLKDFVSLLIFISVFASIWLGYAFEFYGLTDAVIITVSVLACSVAAYFFI